MSMSRDDAGRDPSPDILLVDDEHSNLTLLSQGLREAGFAVRIATTGSEALRHCDNQLPELAMLATRLPDMPGRDVAVDLRDRCIPFILLSTPLDDEVVAQSIELGAYSYLCKPLDAGKIVPVIKAALRRGAEKVLSTSGGLSAVPTSATSRETSVAIGVLMERHRLTADEAFDVLRRYARSQRRKLSEVALQVIRATEEINIPIKPAGVRARRASGNLEK